MQPAAGLLSAFPAGIQPDQLGGSPSAKLADSTLQLAKEVDLVPIPVTCPSCNSHLNAPDNLAGRTVKCPKCSHAIKIAASATVSAQGSGHSSAEEARLAVDPPPIRRVRTNIAALDEKDLTEGYADVPVTTDPPVERTETHEPAVSRRLVYALAIPATILGLVGVLLSWLPVLALLSVPLGGLGLLLGMAALIVSIAQRGRGIPLALAGSLLSLATLIVAVLQLANAISFFRIGNPIDPSPVETAYAATPRANSAQEKGAVPGTREPEWVDVRKGTARLGDVGVKVISSVLRNVEIRNEILGERTVSDTKYLCIRLEVQNLSKNRKLDFRGWSRADTGALSLGDLLGTSKDASKVAEALAGAAVYAATLTDNAHNRYNRLKLDLGSQVAGQVQGEKSIYPGTSVEDLVIFEPPVAGTQFLRLELPATAFGGTGTLRLQIPTAVIAK